MKRRRGWSLLEVAIATSLTGLLLAGIAVLLTVLFRTEGQVRGDFTQQITLARLNQQFRDDSHAATACEAVDACQLTLADGRTIRYAWQPPQIVREVVLSDAVEHRDAFTLPKQAEVTFALINRDARQFARLTIAASGESQRYATPVRPAEIDALIGLSRPLIPQEPQP